MCVITFLKRYDLNESTTSIFTHQLNTSVSLRLFNSLKSLTTDILWYTRIHMYLYLKGLFTNFEYITFFSCPTKSNIFYQRPFSKKHLWLEIIKIIACSKSVRPSTIIYIIYITRTDFVHPFLSSISSQSGFIEMNLL